MPICFSSPRGNVRALRLLVGTLLVVLTGCSQLTTRTEVVTYGSGFPAINHNNEADYRWQAIRFRMPRAADGSSNWNMDPLLAHKVIAPVLLEYSQQLPLWRFHRRSAPDGAGHQFSFIFLTDTATADAIHAWVAAEPLLPALQQAGLLDTVIYQRDGFDGARIVAATSDPNWAPSLQAQWPSFIMGVSATWLGLIDETLAAANEEHESIADLLARYSAANASINQLWAKQGQHAFFHHLSAVFGYRAVNIRKAIHF